MQWWRVATISAVVGGAILTGTASGSTTPAVAKPRHHRRARPPLPPAPPLFDPSCIEAPPPSMPPAAPWIRVGGFKQRGPKLNRSEGGITLALSERIAFQLHYERTAQAPMMRHDHDDGVLGRLRLSF